MSKSTYLLLVLLLIFFSVSSTKSQTLISEYNPYVTSDITNQGQGGNIIDGNGDWFTFASLPAGSSTSGAACAYLNGKIYHFGGSPGPSAEYLAWDEATDVWTSLGNMPGGARYYLSAETVADKIYVIGGSTGWPTPTGAVEIFDGTNWSTGASMPTALHDIGTAVYLDRYIYVVGGMAGAWTDYTNAVQVYDTQTDTWTTATNFPLQAGCMAGGCVGNIIVMGAPMTGGGSGFDTNLIYEGEINPSDPTMITWTLSTGTLRDVGYRIGGGVAGDQYANNMVFFVGGQHFAAYSNQAVGYDPVTDVVTIYPNKPTPMTNIPNFVSGTNMMYVMGGYDGTYNLTCEGMEYDMIPVPVELTSFIASIKENDIILSWVTATETNNQGFEVERNSGNGFENIGYVPGFGTTSERHSYSFTDASVEMGSYSYRLKQINFDGSYEYSDVVEGTVSTPSAFSLRQNHPNPFNPSTKIKYSVSQTSNVELKIYDVVGREIQTLVDEVKPMGTYEVEFNAVNLPSGIYFYRIQAGSFIETKKMTLLK